ncbi:hypothetical protein [[Clostridium] polysaccharolyticum]|uniref:Uncharacterized protein n=1 Tax=[Clostridium] polysaccharolyticum TaxID=29364 RepID=A0A1I0CIL9_9FIRM|nr:hypothetical protein [[Clostridium] polysaccharolyticum]SET18990.1 hypothetical protein SAMN04487772_11014 [[Clostridium] polysaccharolyticum]
MDGLNQEMPMDQKIDARSGFPPAYMTSEQEPYLEEIDVKWIKDAVIEEIFKEEMTFHVRITYHEPYQNTTERIKSLELLVSEYYTKLYDQEQKAIFPDVLKEGMVIDALIASDFIESDNAMTEAFQILVVSAPFGTDAIEGKVLQVNIRIGHILIAPINDPLQVLCIVVSEETVIFSSQSRMIPMDHILPGMFIRVEHGNFVSSSTPPQTTATTIQVLKN